MIRAMKDATGRPDRARRDAGARPDRAPRDAGVRPDLPLEPDRETLERWFDATRDELVRFVEQIPTAPSWDHEGVRAVVESFQEGVPEEGRPYEAVLERLRPAFAKALGTTGTGYFAYIPGGGIPTAGLASVVANFTNRFINVSFAAPALVQIETTTLAWLARMMGMPEGAGGIFTSGGSLSNLAAICAARAARLGGENEGGVLYFSEQTHASVAKAARVAGFPERALRVLPVDARFRLVPDALAQAVAEDRRASLRPFFVVTNAGTTNTGAVDPTPAILEIAREHGLWTHVDGAYGGFFRAVPGEGEHLLPGLERCDSITLDPHKGLFLPYGTGCLLVREPQTLIAAHGSKAHYLADTMGIEDVANYTDWSPELSRDFRGLRVWLPFMVHGVAAFRAQLAEKLALTRRAHERLAQARLGDEPLFDVVDEPQLSIVAFRARPPAGHRLDASAFGAEVLRRVNARKRVFLSSTTIDGRYVLRLCILSFRSHAEHVDDAVTSLIEEARDLAGARGAGARSAAGGANRGAGAAADRGAGAADTQLRNS
jgi:aromatic-L-amino-acid decarboxylase